jgi:hypothetical protein
MNYSNLPEHLRKRLLLMQKLKAPAPAVEKKILAAKEKPSKLPTHDWGIFGEYEFLGAGTPYTQKIEAGTAPRNDLDRIAMYHDGQYAWTDRMMGVQRSVGRGVVDYGAGAAMTVAAFNPWSDLTMKDRVLAFAAGQALMTQGILRLNPAFFVAGVTADIIFY